MMESRSGGGGFVLQFKPICQGHKLTLCHRQGVGQYAKAKHAGFVNQKNCGLRQVHMGFRLLSVMPMMSAPRLLSSCTTFWSQVHRALTKWPPSLCLYASRAVGRRAYLFEWVAQSIKFARTRSDQGVFAGVGTSPFGVTNGTYFFQNNFSVNAD